MNNSVRYQQNLSFDHTKCRPDCLSIYRNVLCNIRSPYSNTTKLLFFQPGWVSFNKSGTQHEHGKCKCGIYFLVLFCTPVRCNNNVSVHLAVLLYIEIYWTCFNVYLKCLNVCCKDLSDKIQV